MNYKIFGEVDISDINPNRNSKSEMSTSQITFLCSLIKKFSPQKIVEGEFRQEEQALKL